MLSGLKASLEEINANLKDIEERREDLIKRSREVIILCSKSIVGLHRRETMEAERMIKDARLRLDELRTHAKTDLIKYIAIAEQELVEAYTLKSILERKALPNMIELGVTGTSYVNGLADSIGEIKRMIYDQLREGRVDIAISLFDIMQEIYSVIYPFGVYDNLIPGFRRKLDVARMLIEDIRAVIAEETRRGLMLRAISNLENILLQSRP